MTTSTSRLPVGATPERAARIPVDTVAIEAIASPMLTMPMARFSTLVEHFAARAGAVGRGPRSGG